jgi:hypothetical protein
VAEHSAKKACRQKLSVDLFVLTSKPTNNKMNMWKHFRGLAAGLVALASLVFMAGCSLNNDSPGNSQPITPVSYISLYNASPNAPELRMSVDNMNVGVELDYGDYTGYLPFRTGERTFQFGPSGADNVTIDTTVTLSEGKAYSVFVADDYNKASIIVTNDNSPDPSAGKAKVRLINLSPDAGAMQVSLKGGGSNLIAPEGFKHVSEFGEIVADAYDLEVTQPDGSVKLSLPNIVFHSGKFYTIVVKGYKVPPSGNTNVLSATVLGN